MYLSTVCFFKWFIRWHIIIKCLIYYYPMKFLLFIIMLLANINTGCLSQKLVILSMVYRRKTKTHTFLYLTNWPKGVARFFFLPGPVRIYNTSSSLLTFLTKNNNFLYLYLWNTKNIQLPALKKQNDADGAALNLGHTICFWYI